MLILKSLDVTSYDVNQLTTTWAFQPTTELLSDYTIDVYRSENPGIEALAGYDLIASGLSADDYSYTDVTVAGLYDPLRTWYYKLRLKNTATNAVDVQPERPGYRKGAVSDRFALELLRRKSIALDRHAQRDFYVLKRRTFGTHCPTCWDTTLSRVTATNCEASPSCFGTGWTTGYFNAIYTKGMMNAAPQYNQITMFGEFAPQDGLFTMLNFPPLRSKDLIVDENNKRWIVKDVRPVQKNGFLIEQNAHCALIALDDPVYDIDNNIGVLSSLPAVTITQGGPNRYAHLVTKDYFDLHFYSKNQVYFERFAGADRVIDGYGSKFTIANQVTSVTTLVAGSVQLIINGVYYLSGTDQTDITLGWDFHITDLDVIIHDIANQGTIDLKDSDIIGVHYQLQSN